MQKAQDHVTGRTTSFNVFLTIPCLSLKAIICKYRLRIRKRSARSALLVSPGCTLDLLICQSCGLLVRGAPSSCQSCGANCVNTCSRVPVLVEQAGLIFLKNDPLEIERTVNHILYGPEGLFRSTFVDNSAQSGAEEASGTGIEGFAEERYVPREPFSEPPPRDNDVLKGFVPGTMPQGGSEEDSDFKQRSFSTGAWTGSRVQRLHAGATAKQPEMFSPDDLNKNLGLESQEKTSAWDSVAKPVEPSQAIESSAGGAVYHYSPMDFFADPEEPDPTAASSDSTSSSSDADYSQDETVDGVPPDFVQAMMAHEQAEEVPVEHFDDAAPSDYGEQSGKHSQTEYDSQSEDYSQAEHHWQADVPDSDSPADYPPDTAAQIQGEPSLDELQRESDSLPGAPAYRPLLTESIDPASRWEEIENECAPLPQKMILSTKPTKHADGDLVFEPLPAELAHFFDQPTDSSDGLATEVDPVILAEMENQRFALRGKNSAPVANRVEPGNRRTDAIIPNSQIQSGTISDATDSDDESRLQVLGSTAPDDSATAEGPGNSNFEKPKKGIFEKLFGWLPFFKKDPAAKKMDASDIRALTRRKGYLSADADTDESKSLNNKESRDSGVFPVSPVSQFEQAVLESPRVEKADPLATSTVANSAVDSFSPGVAQQTRVEGDADDETLESEPDSTLPKVESVDAAAESESELESESESDSDSETDSKSGSEDASRTFDVAPTSDTTVTKRLGIGAAREAELDDAIFSQKSESMTNDSSLEEMKPETVSAFAEPPVETKRLKTNETRIASEDEGTSIAKEPKDKSQTSAGRRRTKEVAVAGKSAKSNKRERAKSFPHRNTDDKTIQLGPVPISSNILIMCVVACVFVGFPAFVLLGLLKNIVSENADSPMLPSILKAVVKEAAPDAPPGMTDNIPGMQGPGAGMPMPGGPPLPGANPMSGGLPGMAQMPAGLPGMPAQSQVQVQQKTQAVPAFPGMPAPGSPATNKDMPEPLPQIGENLPPGQNKVASATPPSPPRKPDLKHLSGLWSLDFKNQAGQIGRGQMVMEHKGSQIRGNGDDGYGSYQIGGTINKTHITFRKAYIRNGRIFGNPIPYDGKLSMDKKRGMPRIDGVWKQSRREGYNTLSHVTTHSYAFRAMMLEMAPDPKQQKAKELQQSMQQPSLQNMLDTVPLNDSSVPVQQNGPN